MGASDSFFPARADRDVRDEVIREYPFPLAVTYARLQDELELQEPVAAAWQMRDAMESFLKFSASLAVADALASGPDPKLAGELAGRLLKWGGLVLGDWHELVRLPLKPLEEAARAGRLDCSGRRLPELYLLFFSPKNGRPSPLHRLIQGDGSAFIAWRNREFGHGLFRRDRAWYAKETLGWIDRLHALYDGLKPVLAGWSLVGQTPGGERVEWQGTDRPPHAPPHEHEPWGEPLPMLLVHEDGRELPLGPLLSVQHCTLCGHPAAFYFDKSERKKYGHSTHFLEYFGGHPHIHANWNQTLRLAGFLPPEFEFTREAHDPDELAEGIRLAFRDFDAEYFPRPTSSNGSGRSPRTVPGATSTSSAPRGWARRSSSAAWSGSRRRSPSRSWRTTSSRARRPFIRRSWSS